MFLGKLVLQLAAETSNFGRDMGAAAQAVERLTKKIKGAANDVAHFALAFSAAATGAIATASKFDAGVARSLEKVKGQFNALAVEVARTLQPAMEALADIVGGLARAWRSLDPATKAQISDWAVFALKVSVAGLAISKVAGLVTGVAGAVQVLSGLLPTLAGLFTRAFSVAPLVKFGVALAGLVGGFVLLAATVAGVVAGIGAAKIAMAEMDATAQTRSSAARTDRLTDAMNAKMRERSRLGDLERQWRATPDRVTRSGRIDDSEGRLILDEIQRTKARIQAKDAEIAAIRAEREQANKAIVAAGPAPAGSGLSADLGIVGAVTAALKEGAGLLVKPFENLFSKMTGGAVAAPIPIEGQGFRRTIGPDGRLDLLGSSPTATPFQSMAGAAPRSSFDAVGTVGPGRNLMKDLTAAADQLKATFLQASGLFGQVVLQAVQGDWVNAVATLIGSSRQFQAVAELAGGAAQYIADSLGSVIEAIAPAIDFVAVGLMVLGDLFKLLEAPLKVLVDVALRGLYEVLRTVALIILGIITGLGNAWNGIVGAIQGVFRALGSIEILGGKPLDFLNDWADGLEGAKAPVDELAAAMAALSGLTYEEAKAKAHATAEQLRLNKAVSSAVEQFTNLPGGYKVALARFNAATGEAPRGPGGSPAPAPTPGGPPGPGGAPAAGGGGLAVQVNIDGHAVVAHVEAKLRRDGLRGTGRPYPLAPRY